ncbi:MAG TPA: hypothetical protein PLW44_03255 [Chitinophagales bacterium]|nr:hypothetical protein [Chitinophagales bacterium]
MHTRDEVLQVLTSGFIDNADVYALWQGGSSTFDRSDEWSDIDLMLITPDGYEKQAMQQAESLLESNFGIDMKFEIDPPQWPGMTQTFFRLKNASPFLLVDFSILPLSAPDKFSAPEIHGNPIVLFDKQSIIHDVQPMSYENLKRKLKARIAIQKHKQEIFRVLVDKEINRSNAIDAFIFYWSYTLAPLVEMLRIKHATYHWNFGSRYLNKHLPADIAAELEQLYFVRNLEDLKQKNVKARAWLNIAFDAALQSLK